jgi:hypothetical protein
MLNINFIIVSLYINIMYFFSGLFLITPITLLNYNNQKFGFFIKNIYYINIGFILKYLLKTEIYVNSNKLIDKLMNEKNQVVLTQNHYTEIDYLFLSYILSNINSFYKMFKYKLMFVAKKTVGYIFLGVGLFSTFSKDIYLKRNINNDSNYLNNNNNANILYIFPEGTCYNINTKVISDKFVKDNKLINYKYHLYPRITGLSTIIDNHYKYKKIYDLTVLYDTINKEKLGNVFKLHSFIYKYKFPTKVYININKYDIHDNIELKTKMEVIFKNKDKFIHNFNTNHNKFEKINYNFYIGFKCFIISNIISLLSIYSFINFEFVKTFYLFELIFYLFYFFFLY